VQLGSERPILTHWSPRVAQFPKLCQNGREVTIANLYCLKKIDPIIGEHNEYVFGELLGMPASEIKQLIDEQVIY